MRVVTDNSFHRAPSQRTIEDPGITYSELREQIDRHLLTLVDGRKPASLYDPVRHVLESGGKRVRGVMTLLAAGAVGGDIESAMPAAAAVEMLHAFTLVHDDIMDNAPTRRGRATVHTKWDVGTAILVGDVLIGIAQGLLLNKEHERCEQIADAFSRGVVEVCEGQALDREFETRTDLTEDDYLQMIGMKTGRLAEMAITIGAHIGVGDLDHVESLGSFARDLGLAFQIRDDLLDVVGEGKTFGKEIGKDIVEGKRTFLVVTAASAELDEEDRRLLDELLESPGLPSDRVPAMRSLFERCGAIERAEKEIERYSRRAIESLDDLPDRPEVAALADLCRQLVDRTV